MYECGPISFEKKPPYILPLPRSQATLVMREWLCQMVQKTPKVSSTLEGNFKALKSILIPTPSKCQGLLRVWHVSLAAYYEWKAV